MHTRLDAPTNRMLRQFAGLWIVFSGTIAAIQEIQYGRRTLALVLVLTAITIGPLGLMWPRAVRPIFVAWTALARPVGWIVSRVILGMVFYGLVTPIALVFRITGRDALGVGRQADAGSYWRIRPRSRDKAHYLRQF